MKQIVGHNFKIKLDERQLLAIESAANENRNVSQRFADMSILDAVHGSHGGLSERGKSQGNKHLVKVN